MPRQRTAAPPHPRSPSQAGRSDRTTPPTDPRRAGSRLSPSGQGYRPGAGPPDQLGSTGPQLYFLVVDLDLLAPVSASAFSALAGEILAPIFSATSRVAVIMVPDLGWANRTTSSLFFLAMVGFLPLGGAVGEG